MNPFTQSRFLVFKAGKYPQGTYTVEQVNEIAKFYNPAIHEAPVWIGHPNMFQPEPEGLAYVSALSTDGKGNLFAELHQVSDKLAQLARENKFKKFSIELRTVPIEDSERLYLGAIGLTNRPQVVGLDTLKFSQSESLIFNFDNDQFFSNQSNNIPMFKSLLASAVKFGVDVSGITEESHLPTLVERMDAKFSAQAAEIAQLTADKKTLTEQIAQFADTQSNAILDAAIASGKILPADREKFSAFVNSNPAQAQAMFNTMPVAPGFKSDTVPAGSASGSDNKDKFKKADGSPLTYADFLGEVKKNPKFADAFSDDDVSKIKADFPL